LAPTAFSSQHVAFGWGEGEVIGDKGAAAFDQLATLVRQHEWLVSCRADHWILRGIWGRVPSAWQHFLLGLSDEQLTTLPTTLDLGGVAPVDDDSCATNGGSSQGAHSGDSTGTHPVSGVCPSDLRALLVAARAAQQPSATAEENASAAAAAAKQQQRRRGDSGWSAGSPPPVNRWLAEVGLTPKKRHEVARLAPLVAHAAAQSGADVVIDFGAGLGCVDNFIPNWPRSS
jgi:hypothetical protein